MDGIYILAEQNLLLMKLLFKQDIKKNTDLNKPQSIIAYFNGNLNGRQTKIQTPTGHKVLAKHFNAGKVIPPHYALDRNEINASLKKMESCFYEESNNEIQNGIEPDKSTLKRSLRTAKGLNPIIITNILFTDFLDNIFLKEMNKMLNPQRSLGLAKNTQKNYRHLSVIMREYDKQSQSTSRRLSLQHATKGDLDNIITYLQEKRYSQSTISKRIAEIKRVASYSKEKEVLVSNAYADFKNIKAKSKLPEQIIYLTEEEVKLITNPDENLPPYLINTQKIIIIHLATGQRVSDVMNLENDSFTEEEDGTFTATIRQQKTGKVVDVPIIEERAIKVIKEGLFRVISDQNYNNYIKLLAKRVGINSQTEGQESVTTEDGKRLVTTKGPKYKYLTSHTFRRTALTRLAQQGIPEYYIMQISAHAKSEQLHSYLGINPNSIQRTKDLKKLMTDALKKT